MCFSINDILIRLSVACLSRILTCFFYCRSILLLRVQASVASTLIFLNKLPLKLNPIIRPIMDSIKKEEQTLMQVSLNAVILYLTCRTVFGRAKHKAGVERETRATGKWRSSAPFPSRACLAIRAHFALWS